MAIKTIGPKVDRITYSPDMAWISNEKRIKDVEDWIDGGGGGGGDDPTIGFGLHIVGNKIVLSTSDTATENNRLPATSNSVAKELDKAEIILDRV